MSKAVTAVVAKIYRALTMRQAFDIALHISRLT